MVEILQVRKDRVLAAAKNCDEARETLKALFPEAFQNSGPSFAFDSMGITVSLDNGNVGRIERRSNGELKNKALYLPDAHGYHWVVKKDSAGYPVLTLVPDSPTMSSGI